MLAMWYYHKEKKRRFTCVQPAFQRFWNVSGQLDKQQLEEVQYPSKKLKSMEERDTGRN